MTNTRDFTQRVEHEVRNSRSLSESACEVFAKLPVETRIAYGSAVRFLGCKSAVWPTTSDVSVSEVDRIHASKLMLLGLYLDTNEPRWSSWMLDRLLQAVISTPGACASDLLHALHEVLEEHSVELTEPVFHLVRQIVVKCFTEHRASYEAADWTWMVRKTIEHATPAQAYLALLALPPDLMPRCAAAILKELEDTPYRNEASWLEEYLGDDDSRRLAEPSARGEVATPEIDVTLANVRDHR